MSWIDNCAEIWNFSLCGVKLMGQVHINTLPFPSSQPVTVTEKSFGETDQGTHFLKTSLILTAILH